ncbi:MAG: galactokinase [Alkalispirochaetaceae bacterium]
MSSNLETALADYLSRDAVSHLINRAYPNIRHEVITDRFTSLVREFTSNFPELPTHGIRFISTPGRTELGGNHTDHNLGRVVAASIEVDALAAVLPTDDRVARVKSEGFTELFEVKIDENTPVPGENSTTALLRGVISRFKELGYQVGGFAAQVQSDVLPGSGMSSSAAIEVLFGTILSSLYNADTISSVQLAKVGQFAENKFMGKPCGLMDQIACATGGIVAIDFKNPSFPTIETIEADFQSFGYHLAIVNTGGSHADLTEAYASIPEEMQSVARLLNREHLRGIELEALLSAVPLLREKVGDRAILRSLHFIAENARAQKQREALGSGDIERFLTLARESAGSSWRLLQNCVAPGKTTEQPLAAGIAIAEALLDGEGAVRVHGGGFAGTMQVFLPESKRTHFVGEMETIFGPGCVTLTGVRQLGSVAFPALFD